MYKSILATLVVACSILTACGGGGSGGTTPPPVVNQAPVASFTLDKEACDAPPCTVNITDTSRDNDGSVVSWQWSFGSTAKNPPPQTYNTAGSYTITLTVTDNGGKTSAVASKTVVVRTATSSNIMASICDIKPEGQNHNYIGALNGDPRQPQMFEAYTCKAPPSNAVEMVQLSRVVPKGGAPSSSTCTPYLAPDAATRRPRPYIIAEVDADLHRSIPGGSLDYQGDVRNDVVRDCASAVVNVAQNVFHSYVWYDDNRGFVFGATNRLLNGTKERHTLTTISSMGNVSLHENMVDDTINLIKGYGLYLQGSVIKFVKGKHAGVLGGADSAVMNSDGTVTFSRLDGKRFAPDGSNYDDDANLVQSPLTLWHAGYISDQELIANTVGNVTNYLGLQVRPEGGKWTYTSVETTTIRAVMDEANRVALNGTPDSRFSVKTRWTLHICLKPEGTPIDAAFLKRCDDQVAAYTRKVPASTDYDGTGARMTAPAVNPGAILLEGVTLQPVS